MKKLVFASSNQGKIAEMRAIMPAGIQLLTPAELGFTEDIAETGKTFEDNAALKATALFEASGIPCFADDSGLEVTALNKAPGVKSARYAGEPSNAGANNALLLKQMEGKSNRKARFVCVICLKTADRTFFFEGEVKGHIAEAASGEQGFGYDPLFIPDGYDKTFADLGSNIKNKISHRKMALNKMLPFLEYL